MKHLLFHLTLLFTVALLSRCANVVAPTGGPKDTQAPKLRSSLSTPDSLHLTNHKEQSINLVFDEEIQLKTLSTQLKVTPYYDPQEIKTTVRKNELTLTFKQPLQENTTYILNFGKSIADVHEGKTADNLTFCFSTGPIIDSLTLAGTIKHHFTNKPASKLTVCLYDQQWTDTLLTSTPMYTSETNGQGVYSFNYLKNQDYILVAFKDLNYNNQPDPNTETIALYPTPINPSETSKIPLKSFRQNSTLKVTSARPDNDHYIFKYNKGIKSIFIKPSQYITTKKNRRESEVWYSSNQFMDTLSFNLQITDSLDNSLDTTLYLPKIDEESVQKSKSDISIELIDNQYINNKFSVYFSISKPSQSIIPDSIDIYTSTDTSNLQSNSDFNYTLDQSTSTLHITNENVKGNITLLFKRGTARFQSQSSSPTLKTIEPNTSENTGTISGQLNSSLDNLIFQLVSSSGKIIHELLNPSDFKFQYLQPDTYTIVLVEDRNNNGRYDTGDIHTRTTPETRYHHPKTIKLKANWEIADIDITYP